MSRTHGVVGDGSAPSNVINEGLKDLLEEGDVVALPWYGKPTPGLAAVYDYILDNEVEFVMFHTDDTKPPKSFTSADTGSTSAVTDVHHAILKTVGSGGKVLFMWDDEKAGDLIDVVFDTVAESVLVLELTNGLAPISLSLVPAPPVAAMMEEEVDPTDDAPISFTRDELGIMPVPSLRRLAEAKGLPAGVSGKANFIKVILGEELSEAALPPAPIQTTTSKVTTDLSSVQVEVVKEILDKSEPVKPSRPEVVIGMAELQRSLESVGAVPLDEATVGLLRTRALEFGTSILEHVPQGRNRSLAITALEDALDRAVKGVLTNA